MWSCALQPWLQSAAMGRDGEPGVCEAGMVQPPGSCWCAVSKSLCFRAGQQGPALWGWGQQVLCAAHY